MPKSRHQMQKERRELRTANERELDTIYYLDFIPKNGQSPDRTTLLNDLWCVRLPRNPENDPQLVEDAIRRFEENHKVDSWTEVASEYRVNGFYYP